MFLCVSVLVINQKGDVMDLDWKLCSDCGDDVHVSRYQVFCRLCEKNRNHEATKERKKWTVVQEYTKGAYQFVTATSAPTTLKQTNPKETRV